MTEELFRADAYLKGCEATIIGVNANEIEFDRTVFYPMGGGQPGDQGQATLADGTILSITDTVKAPGGCGIRHLSETSLSEDLAGSTVKLEIDWARRHRLMRIHTLLHLLCSVVPAGVTGGSIRDDGTGRLDFDLPEQTLDKGQITAQLNRLVERNHAVTARWISDEELDAQPELVRTMSVQPPRGEGRVRVLNIEGVDLQPCGGTHVAATGEIGEVRVGKIEKKGKHNRRVNLALVRP